MKEHERRYFAQHPLLNQQNMPRPKTYRQSRRRRRRRRHPNTIRGWCARSMRCVLCKRVTSLYNYTPNGLRRTWFFFWSDIYSYCVAFVISPSLSGEVCTKTEANSATRKQTAHRWPRFRRRATPNLCTLNPLYVIYPRNYVFPKLISLCTASKSSQQE